MCGGVHEIFWSLCCVRGEHEKCVAVGFMKFFGVCVSGDDHGGRQPWRLRSRPRPPLGSGILQFPIPFCICTAEWRDPICGRCTRARIPSFAYKGNLARAESRLGFFWCVGYFGTSVAPHGNPGILVIFSL